MNEINSADNKEDNSDFIHYDEFDYNNNQVFFKFDVEIPNKRWITDDGLHHRMVKG